MAIHIGIYPSLELWVMGLHSKMLFGFDQTIIIQNTNCWISLINANQGVKPNILTPFGAQDLTNYKFISFSFHLIIRLRVTRCSIKLKFLTNYDWIQIYIASDKATLALLALRHTGRSRLEIEPAGFGNHQLEFPVLKNLKSETKEQ